MKCRSTSRNPAQLDGVGMSLTFCAHGSRAEANSSRIVVDVGFINYEARAARGC